MTRKLMLGTGVCALALAGPLVAAPQAAAPQAPAATATPSAADIDKLVDLLRKDVRAEKADLIAKTMNLDAAQAAAFWPVYKLYETERTALGNEKLGIIQDYADHYSEMNDAKAKGLITRSIALEEKTTALQKKYADEMMKVLPAKTVGRFFQVERRINMLLDLKLSSAIPLVN
jgi:hypothetical protein